jgi:hypothetical protein
LNGKISTKTQDLLVLIRAAKAQLRCLFFNNREGATKKCAKHSFSSFYVAHLAQPNESSRRRVVAVIKNDWAQPNPKQF